MQRKEIVLGLALGALALSVAPAEAQSAQHRRHHPSPPTVIQRPPPLLGPNSLGLIEQGFQIMRGTSHAPNEFLYGRWNPQFQTIRPPVHIQGGIGGGGGYYYPPNYGYYPSYPYGYQQFNGFYPYGYQQPVIQREVIIYNNGTAPNAGYGGAQGVPQQGGQPAPRPMEGDFYLRDSGRQETLSTALDDIRKAWLNGDFGRFQARVREEGKLRIFVSGEFKYAVEGRDFTAMIKDAMGKIDTLAFEFDRPRADEPGRAQVTGRHTFLDQDKQKQTTQISYTLEQLGGRWKIVEAGSAPSAPPAK